MAMDNKPIHLLFTHMIRIASIGEVVVVPQGKGAERILVNTSHVHLEYTTFMRGVYMVHQL